MVSSQNKLSGNVKKLSTLFYEKPSKNGNVLHRLADSPINNHKIKREL